MVLSAGVAFSFPSTRQNVTVVQPFRYAFCDDYPSPGYRRRG